MIVKPVLEARRRHLIHVLDVDRAAHRVGDRFEPTVHQARRLSTQLRTAEIADQVVRLGDTARSTPAARWRRGGDPFGDGGVDSVHQPVQLASTFAAAATASLAEADVAETAGLVAAGAPLAAGVVVYDQLEYMLEVWFQGIVVVATLRSVVTLACKLVVVAGFVDLGALGVVGPLFRVWWAEIEIETVAVSVKGDHVFVFRGEPG